ncbi:MAG: hypothetical protein EOP34_06265 [Rickettsiales bacterium]|nr:MAG: hypothetical protein EOP34_06265 [Rickettsiales bacterium]
MIQATKRIGTGLATTGLIGAGVGIGLVLNACFSVSISSRLRGNDTDRQKNEPLHSLIRDTQHIMDDRSTEGQDTAANYHLTPDQAAAFSQAQDNVDRNVESRLTAMESLHPEDPESVGQAEALQADIEQCFDDFIRQVDSITSNARHIEDESSTDSGSPSPSPSPSSFQERNTTPSTSNLDDYADTSTEPGD